MLVLFLTNLPTNVDVAFLYPCIYHHSAHVDIINFLFMVWFGHVISTEVMSPFPFSVTHTPALLGSYHNHSMADKSKSKSVQLK
jgi:hypothetical protein